jgi:phosphate-selective porin OprO/OprP
MTTHILRVAAVSLLALSAGGTALAADDQEILRRLEALETRLQQLEQRNRQLETEKKALEERVEWRSERLERLENRVGATVKTDVSPTIAEPSGNHSFKVRGVLQGDYAAFSERRGGYAYNNGTALRRARLGAEGTAWRNVAWRFEVDFAGNAVAVQDAYLAYAPNGIWTFTLGQTKAPFALESNTSDNFNTFLERGMANNAFGAIGAERRLGVFAQYNKGPFTVGVAFTGDNESSTRVDTAPGEGYGFNGRATWEPINDADTRRVVHFGIGSYWRTRLREGTTPDAVRLSDRPNVRVDNGRLADTGVITNVKHATFVGGEAAFVYDAFSLQGEYGRLHLKRNAQPGLDFDGGYVFGSWFLTGESRTFRNGVVDRVRPAANFNPGKGAAGAFELVARYDWFDFTDTPVLARVGNKGHSTTLGLNWYLNPNVKVLANWVRFTGTNTPLDPVGTRTAGDAYAARLHIDW